MLSANIHCSNCSGCFYDDVCYDYDPDGSNGPPDVQSCKNAGGFDCSGNYAHTLKNPAFADRLFLCFVDYSFEYNQM